MKIMIKKQDGPNLRLQIPSGLVLNRFTAGFAVNYLKKHGINITKAQAIRMIKELNRYRRSHPDWVLVKAENSDGRYMEIKF